MGYEMSHWCEIEELKDLPFDIQVHKLYEFFIQKWIFRVCIQIFIKRKKY